jgi:hypothetical protein
VKCELRSRAHCVVHLLAKQSWRGIGRRSGCCGRKRGMAGVIETGGGVSGALQSLCLTDVPLRANRSAFAIAFGSCSLQDTTAIGAVKLSKRFEVVINWWCCDCWLPSAPQRQLTSRSRVLPELGRLRPSGLRQQRCAVTFDNTTRRDLSHVCTKASINMHRTGCTFWWQVHE